MSKIIQFFYFFLFIYNNVESQQINKQIWECGDNFLNRFLSLKGAELSCTKNQYLKINDCCRIHDSCYGNKILLQTQCDSFLDKCFEEATSVEVGIKKFTCKALIITFELAVEMFGSRAFNKTK